MTHQVIVEMCAPLSSVFSFHLDFEVSGFLSVKLSFSNLYRAVKVALLDQIMSDRGMQVPLTDLASGALW